MLLNEGGRMSSFTKVYDSYSAFVGHIHPKTNRVSDKVEYFLYQYWWNMLSNFVI